MKDMGPSCIEYSFVKADSIFFKQPPFKVNLR